MRKLRHPHLIYGLVSTLACILMTAALLDAFLWHVDPYGVVDSIVDYNTLQMHSIPAPDGERYLPGIYPLRRYTVIIDSNGFRAVPDSNAGDCRIVFVGDSTTFGTGSDKSFVDFLAPSINAVTINAAFQGYEVENVAASITTIPADGYVWLTFPNDYGSPFVWQRPSGNIPPAIVLYRSFLYEFREPEPVRADYYRRHAAGIIGREDVLTFAFEGEVLADIAVELGAVPIDFYTETVSRFDGHASEASNAAIADSMRGAVLAFVERQCPSK